MLYGSTTRNIPSRFLGEIPSDYCKETARVNSSFGNEMHYGGQSSVYQNNKGFGFSSFGNSKGVTEKQEIVQTYTSGQSVEHKVFGRGMIVKVTPMSGDTLLEIAFEDVGTKKIMANFAKLKLL